MKIVYLLICVALLTILFECDPVEAGWFRKATRKVKNVGKKIGKGVKKTVGKVGKVVGKVGKAVGKVGNVVRKGTKAARCAVKCRNKRPRVFCIGRCLG